MREAFVKHAFSPDTQTLLTHIVAVVDDYAGQGYRLSLRQLYYQLVARDLIENTLQSYKRIGDIVSNARLAGLIDWDLIEDRGRETITPPMWQSPAHIVKAAAAQFAIDRWADQPNHVEVMVEKAALEGVLIPVCRSLGIRFSANRGYSSSSAMYEAGKRIENMVDKGKAVYLLYLGDHDPSGIDMTRDVRERLSLFSRSSVEVQRLALNYNQIETLHPPENPAKMTDSRAAVYVAEFGQSSWELDAIEPAQLAALVTEAVVALRDDDLYAEAEDRERAMKSELTRFVEQYQREHPED